MISATLLQHVVIPVRQVQVWGVENMSNTMITTFELSTTSKLGNIIYKKMRMAIPLVLQGIKWRRIQAPKTIKNMLSLSMKLSSRRLVMTMLISSV